MRVITAAITALACMSCSDARPAAPTTGDSSADDTAAGVDSSVPADTSVADDGAETTTPLDTSLADAPADSSTPADTTPAADTGADTLTSLDTAFADTSSDAIVPDSSADTASDTGAPDTGPISPPSCAVAGDGRTNCGTGESCCTSLLVSGGTFSRSYDGTSPYSDPQYKATLSDFKLDKYEITVGRFRKFVDAVVKDGWRPTSGSGKHKHLAGGGLNGGAEPGWDTAWNVKLPGDVPTWESVGHLGCNGEYQTWTSTPAANEKKPINCIDWYQAAAFCIWDDGFLPSEAEWNYAAAGGGEHRAYPWGSTPAPAADATRAVYGCYFGTGGTCSFANVAPVGSASAGNGKYGQSDLAGSVLEFTLRLLQDAVQRDLVYRLRVRHLCCGIHVAHAPRRLLRQQRGEPSNGLSQRDRAGRSRRGYRRAVCEAALTVASMERGQ